MPGQNTFSFISFLPTPELSNYIDFKYSYSSIYISIKLVRFNAAVKKNPHTLEYFQLILGDWFCLYDSYFKNQVRKLLCSSNIHLLTTRFDFFSATIRQH